MKVELCFVHLHSPLFFAKKNWGEKLDIANTAKGKLQMSYDREHKELTIKCDGHESIIPSSNIVSMTPISAAPQVTDTPVSPTVIRRRTSAQVSGPTDHVYGGLGAGKARD